jgi:hypothetical protein
MTMLSMPLRTFFGSTEHHDSGAENMTKQRSSNGRGLFYTRDSGGKSEQTPAQYVGWARRRAEELKVTLVARRIKSTT